MKKIAISLAGCFVLLFFPAWLVADGASDAGKIVREDWLIVTLQGKRCGYGSMIQRERDTPGGKQYITDNNQEFKFSREGQVIHMITRSRTLEAEDGTVINFQAESSGAGSNQITRGYRVGDEMILTSGGQQQRVPMPRTALGPACADRKERAMKLEPGATLSLQTFECDFPQIPVTVTAKVLGKEKVRVQDQEMELWKISSTMSVLPSMDIIICVDDQGDAKLVTMPFPGLGEMKLITTTRAEAMKELESLEIFSMSLIAPKQPLPDAQTLQSATFRLSVSNGSSPLALWSGPGQEILESKPGESTVRITVPLFDEKTAAWQLPHAPDPDLKPYMDSSFYIEQTPRIQALAKQAVGDEKNPVLAARKIQSFVRGYIQRKDLSVAFATADETAASRTGDCTEHAVLCAALGRAVGLPTRVVVGFGYLPPEFTGKSKTGLFGFHMWAEAWIGPDQWMAMDAALNNFDVGHIAIAKTALQEVNPMVDLAMPVLNLMQNLQIDVLETKPWNAPAKAY